MAPADRHEDAASAQIAAVRDVLRAISHSPFDVDALLNTVCEHAVRLCRADFGYVFVPEGDHLRLAGSARAPAAMLAQVLEHPPLIDRRTGTGRAMLTGREVQIEDVFADPDWDFRDAQRLSDYRSTMSVPMRKEGEIIGVFASLGWPSAASATRRSSSRGRSPIRLPSSSTTSGSSARSSVNAMS